MIGVLVLLVIFQTSTSLAAAYGIAVTGAMFVDTLLAFVIVRRHVEVAAVAGRRWRCWSRSACIDLVFISLQPAEDPRGRLAAAGARRGAGADHVDLDAGQPRSCPRRPGATAVPLADLIEHAAGPAAAPGAGHGHLPDLGPRHRAGRPDAQPQAQQGAAREERHPDRPHRRDAARAGRGPGARSSRSTTTSRR